MYILQTGFVVLIIFCLESFFDYPDKTMEDNVQEENVRKVEVRFRTSIDKYRVTEKSFQVPFNLNRRGLSQVINHLLGTGTLEHITTFQPFANYISSATPIPFDFLIQDKFLRTPLEAFYKKNNLSQVYMILVLHTASILILLVTRKKLWLSII